jgi:Protein of unknown function (DUF3485)
MRPVIVGIALVLLAGAGAYEIRTRVGGVDPVVAGAVQANLDAIPKGFGDWTGEDRDYDAKQMDRTGSFASLHRLYRNAKTNESIAVLILAGPAQEIGSHDPNRCYVGAGYRPVGAAAKKTAPDAIPQGPCSYWAARFDTDTFPAASLQVVWAWSLDGRWVASDNARYDFVREPALYKLYVSRRLNATDADSVDPTENFLAEFFPAVRTSLAAN